MVAQDVAALFREDLDAGGWGDGRHGFEIRLPPALLDGGLHEVEAVEARSGAPLASHTVLRRLSRYQLDRTSCADLLFDAEFYRRQSAVGHHGLDHYRRIGWRSGFDPHPLFSTDYYLTLWPQAAETDPLSHFEKVGQHGRVSTHPLFDPALFLSRRSARDGASRHPVLAYLELPVGQRPPVSRFFSDAHYASQVDLASTPFSPLLHYLHFGYREGRSPVAGFDPRLFRRLAGLNGSVDPFTTFIRWLEQPPGPRGTAAAIAAPRISVVILNYNKALLTLQCLFHLERFSDPASTEIIILDNGSASEDFDLLSRHARGATVIRLECNRGFGEGCNIGAEQARGELLLFLNNDAFLTRGCLEALEGALAADPAAAAAGPKFLFADGRLQEAGARITACGTAVQLGRGLDPHHPAFNRLGPVDYCSAAALLVRAESFRDVLGFDPCWDPAYYEDPDLCLKLRVRGERTLYVPTATVIHLEHATASDRSLDLRLDDVVEANRLKFLNRWSRELSGAGTFAADHFTARPPRGTAPPSRTLGLFTPYPLIPGGGERYLLTIADVLGEEYQATIQTPNRYSGFRLRNVARELGLDLGHARVEAYPDSLLHPPFDLFVAMGNHLFPSVPAYGTRSFYHCQFPFPMTADQAFAHRRHLGTYEGIIVNSRFTADAIAHRAAQAGVGLPPVHILPPPVPQIGPGPRAERERASILSVGRFAPGGHCKRQDVMVAEFRRLLGRTGETVGLDLAGSLGPDPEARAYLRGLIEDSRDLPVRFHVDPSPQQLAELYRGASLYWHLTGAGEDLLTRPERAEHFGIAIVEAMSAGVAPVVLRAGGPVEIISEGRDGFLIDEPSDLSSRSADLLKRPDLLAAVAARAALRARDFSPASFASRLARIMSAEGRRERMVAGR